MLNYGLKILEYLQDIYYPSKLISMQKVINLYVTLNKEDIDF